MNSKIKPRLLAGVFTVATISVAQGATVQQPTGSSLAHPHFSFAFEKDRKDQSDRELQGRCCRGGE